MYTLVSAPVLGFDLVRRPGGEHVAAVLRAALALREPDLAVLAGCRRPSAESPGLDQAWIAVGALEAATPSVANLIGGVYDASVQRSAEVGSRLRALEVAPLGSLSALLRCLRSEVLDWTWRTAGDVSVQGVVAERATAVLCDAVAAAYCYEDLDAELRRCLAASWSRATRLLPAETREEDGFTARLRHLDLHDLARLRELTNTSRRLGTWSQAVHEASWALHLTGRVRVAADLQLAAVQALVASGMPVADGAGGVWNAVSGAVAARVVEDLLSDEVLEELLRPVRRALDV